MAVDGTHLYWADTAGNAVRRVPKNGGADELVAADTAPQLVAVDADVIVWLSSGGIRRLAKTAPLGSPPVSVYGTASGHTLLLHGDNLYFGDDMVLHSISKWTENYTLFPGGSLWMKRPCDLVGGSPPSMISLAVGRSGVVVGCSNQYSWLMGAVGWSSLPNCPGWALLWGTLVMTDHDVLWGEQMEDVSQTPGQKWDVAYRIWRVDLACGSRAPRVVASVSPGVVHDDIFPAKTPLAITGNSRSVYWTDGVLVGRVPR
jgi:hypothetical protein